MATHSSILAWIIPQTEESCRLQSMGSQRVGHDWACTSRVVIGIKGPSWFVWTSCTPGPQSTILCIVFVMDNYYNWEQWLWDESSFPLHPPCPGAEKQSIPMATAAAGPLIRGAGDGQQPPLPLRSRPSFREEALPSHPLPSHLSSCTAW